MNDLMQLQRLFNIKQRACQDKIDEAYRDVNEDMIARRDAWNWQQAQRVVLALLYGKVKEGK